MVHAWWFTRDATANALTCDHPIISAHALHYIYSEWWITPSYSNSTIEPPLLKGFQMQKNNLIKPWQFKDFQGKTCSLVCERFSLGVSWPAKCSLFARDVGLWRSNFIVTIAVLVAQPGLVHGTIVASFSQEWWQHEAFVFDARAGGLVNVMAV